MMKPPRSALSLAVLLVAASLIGVPEARAQNGTTSSLAAANLRIIPDHHHLLWTFNDVDDPTNPTTGFFISFYLNTTGNFTPETLPLPGWINPGPGGYLRGPSTGVTSGIVTSQPLAGGWTAYKFSARVQGSSTRIYDASRKAETAQGFSSLNFTVAYELSRPLSQVDPYIRSVLGPKAHETRELAAQGIQIRNFTLVIQASGSGSSLSHRGQTAFWSLSNVFVTARGIAVGNFSLTPR
jgi:hypothetical protein